MLGTSKADAYQPVDEMEFPSPPTRRERNSKESSAEAAPREKDCVIIPDDGSWKLQWDVWVLLLVRGLQCTKTSDCITDPRVEISPPIT